MKPPSAGGGGRRRRAVVVVPNPAAPYSRALRIARSLAGQGFEVEIAAVAADGLPREERYGEVILRRYTPGRPGTYPSSLTAHQPATTVGEMDPGRTAAATLPTPRPGEHAGRRQGLAGLLRFALGRGRRAIVGAKRKLEWPYAPRGWWKSLGAELAPADLYHAFGINSLGGAVGLARAARRSGRAGAVVYDVIDLAIESHLRQHLSRPLLALYRRREQRWVRRTQAVVTVNDAIARHLEATWRLPARPTVLLNCPPAVPLADPPEPLIRQATGVPPERRLVLFLGKTGPARGLESAAEAVLRVRDAALVLIGFGTWQARMEALDAAERFQGHHYTLPAVPSDDVPLWAASGDVSLIPVAALSLNHRLSTPNKLWESISGGTPVVVSRELHVMAELIEREGLGATYQGTGPDAIAAGLRAVLDLPDAEREAMRRRVRTAAIERYHWDVVVQPYLGLVGRLVPGQASAVAAQPTGSAAGSVA